jgi:hypothetical protein
MVISMQYKWLTSNASNKKLDVNSTSIPDLSQQNYALGRSWGGLKLIRWIFWMINSLSFGSLDAANLAFSFCSFTLLRCLRLSLRTFSLPI